LEAISAKLIDQLTRLSALAVEAASGLYESNWTRLGAIGVGCRAIPDLLGH